MSRALVLGGGGPVGIGWESGLIAGLADAGVDLRPADLVLGTSAGAAVGAGITLGLEAKEVAAIAGTPPPGGTGGIELLMAEMAQAASGTTSAEEMRAKLGRVSMEAATMPEEDFVALFAQLAGQAWPARFRCTAVDVETADFRVWNAGSGAPLERAVASSCSVPGIFPPVTIGGRRYMDGGMRTALNADVAAGHDAAVVVSCFALELPEGLSDPIFDAMSAALHAELDSLRSGGTRVEVVTPGAEMLELSGWGLRLMDFTLVGEAYAVGQRQAAAEAERLASVWG